MENGKVWAATGVAVVVILGLAYVTIHRNDSRMPQTAGVSAPSVVPPPYEEKAPVPEPAQTARNTVSPVKPPETPVTTPHANPAASAPLPEPPPAPGHPQLELGHLAGTLRVSLPDTPHGTTYSLDYTCYRGNQSPPVAWSGVPSGAKSMVVILERRQKDKPRAWLWELFNLAPGSGKIPGNIPKIAQLNGGARQGRNVYGKAQYAGPCDPHGQIPYAIRLFALDIPLGVEAGAERDDLIRAMNGHVIDAADYEFVHFFKP